MVRSSLLAFASNRPSFWLRNPDNTSDLIIRAIGPIIHRSLGPPVPTYIPLGFRTRLHTDNECCPRLRPNPDVENWNGETALDPNGHEFFFCLVLERK
jgi:hypothetical protein